MKRVVQTFAITAAILAMSVLLNLTPVVAGQTPAAGAKGAAPKPAPPAKTSWGDPDLQGTWDATFSYDWGSTFERDPKFKGRAELTDEELAELQQKATEGDRPGAIPRGGGGTAPAVKTGAAWLGGGYNAWWLEGRVNRQTSQVVDPPDGRLPPLTPAGKEASQTRRKPRIVETWEDMTFWERCLTKGGFPNNMFPRGYNNNTQIVQTPGYVALLHEMIHEVRIIPLDNRPHLPDTVRQWMGDPRGHWEGDTLVVETTNIDPRVSALQPWANLTSRSNSQRMLHTVERFRRVDANLISYRVTVEDPEMYTQPWTVALPLVKNDEMIFEYACHEANYTMSDVLGGARLQEQKEEEARKSGKPVEVKPERAIAPPE